MKVVVYVEGPSDKIAMAELLSPLLELKRQAGVEIDFFDAPAGDKKASVLTKVPIRAVTILRKGPPTGVGALRDLYPKDVALKHETAAELISGVQRNFEQALQSKAGSVDARIVKRFHVFCFKYDLEALV